MIELQNKLIAYFDERIDFHKKQSDLLCSDDRIDEGNFEKVKGNVYEIFKTIISVSDKVSSGNLETKKQFFIQKTEQIPENWITSYDKAMQHGDLEKMHIEKIKLDTIKEIKINVLQIWEESV